jgi:uncharacterized protein (TIGR03086 family)
MTDDLTRLFRAAAADADRVIAGVAADQLGADTPCAGWDVRTLLNHVVGGNRSFLARATDTPAPDRDRDFIGSDPLGAFRASVALLSDAFGQEGFLTRTVSTPFGEGPGAVLVTMRINEFLMHSWDLAVATGQPRDFDPEVVAAAEKSLRNRPIPRGVMFGEERSAPDGASTVDALAAYTGRRVPA